MDPIIDPFYIYLITRLDNIKHVLVMVKVITFLFAIGNLILLLITDNESDYRTRYDSIDGLKKESNLLYIQFRDSLVYANNEIKNNKDLTNEEKVEEGLSRIDKFIKHFNSKIDYITESYNKCILDHTKYKFGLVVSITLFVIAMIIDILVPGTETAYKMLFLSYITPDNIQLGLENSKNAIQWILDMLTQSIEKIK